MGEIGQWTALFGGRRSFQLEIERAKEIGAQFNSGDGGRSIVLDEIPGWLPPMWGSDRKWLYIRRPQGVWKAALPERFDGSFPIRLYQRRKGELGREEVMGGLSIGESVYERKGWLKGEGVSGPIEAADRDESARPEARGFEVEADAVGSAWGAVIAQDERKLLVMGGDYFEAKPVYSLRGGWLIAEDPKAAYTVAYPIHSHASFRDALAEGRLWLCYHGPWLHRFDVKVELDSRSVGQVRQA